MNNDEYIIKYNDDYVHYEGDYLYVSPFKVILKQNIGGTISATPMTGYKGDTVTLSNSADDGYILTNYSISGASLYDTNKFNFGSNDVECEGFWDINYNPLNLPPYTMRVRLKMPNNVTTVSSLRGATCTKVYEDVNDIYDVTLVDNDWSEVLHGNATTEPGLKTSGLIGLIPNGYVKLNILDVLGGNTSGITDMGGLLAGNGELSSVALFDTRDNTDMNWFLGQCSALTSIPDFKTSNVTGFNYTFSGVTAICSLMSSFDTSKAVTMDGMFAHSHLYEFPAVLNTNNVTSMSNMFWACEHLGSQYGVNEGIYKTSSLNTENVVNMSGMFGSGAKLYAYKFLPNMNTRNVTNMDSMFYSAGMGGDGNIFSSMNTSNVSSMRETFANNSITSIPLLDTNKVVDMYGMLRNNNLRTIPSFDTTNVVNLGFFVGYNNNLSSVPPMNCPKVTNMAGMFRETKLSSMANISFTVSSLKSISNMYRSTPLTSISWNYNPNYLEDVTYTFAYCTRVKQGIYSTYSNLSHGTILSSTIPRTFYHCGTQTTASAELALIPTAWGGTKT